MFDWMKKKPVAENKVSERLEIVGVVDETIFGDCLRYC